MTGMSVSEAIGVYLPGTHQSRRDDLLDRALDSLTAAQVKRQIADILRFAFAVGSRVVARDPDAGVEPVLAALREEFPHLDPGAVQCVGDYWLQRMR